jgi:hypothetical protein
MDNIPEDMNKIKLWKSDYFRDFLVILIITIVGIGSFGLGRLSTQKGEGGSAKIFYAEENGSKTGNSTSLTNVAQGNQALESGAYMASKRGKKYYPSDCSAAKSIKEENRIYFDTPQKAEEAGYSASSSC